jgi:hypothetical protein
MPAAIIETNSTPFDKVTIDPVTLDIIENALRWFAPQCHPASANRATPFR